MGRDKVLGLSLAILTAGFAAAFCFRNEPFVESGLKLARAKILDEAIAQRPGPKPYAADPKIDRRKSSLPTVTLQGIESIEPFSDLQPAQPVELEKPAAPIVRSEHAKSRKMAGHAVAATLAADIKPSGEAKPATIGPLKDGAESDLAPIDTEKVAIETKPTGPAAGPAAGPASPVVLGSATSPALLTSAAPPASDLMNGASETPPADIVIRPSSLRTERTELPVQHNAARQSTGGLRDRDILADNSPKNGAPTDRTATTDSTAATDSTTTTDNKTTDDRPRDNRSPETRPPETPVAEHPARDNPSDENPLQNGPTTGNRSNESSPSGSSAGEYPTRENRPREVQPRQEPGAENPAGDADGSAKLVTYRVRRGDTLTKIALHYLGDSSRYREIFKANRDQLRTPNDRLKIGMTLRIPAKTAKPESATGTASKRKSRSNASAKGSSSASHTRKSSSRNVARVPETQSSTPVDGSMGTPPVENMESDRPAASRFVPSRKSPLVPAEKTDADAPPPIQNRGSLPPDMTHYRFFSRIESVRIAGDREDAVIR